MLLQNVYNLGARHVIVTGTGPLGCVPAELAQRSRNGECSPELQRAAALFNPQLTQMLQGLNSEIGSNVFIAANTQQMQSNFITNPGAYGKQCKILNLHVLFNDRTRIFGPPYPCLCYNIDNSFCCLSTGFITSKVACCGQGPYNGLGLCTPLSNLCPNRDVYAFWDPFHPSEKANKIIVQQILTGSSEYMTPMNLSTILAMDSEA